MLRFMPTFVKYTFVESRHPGGYDIFHFYRKKINVITIIQNFMLNNIHSYHFL